MRAVKRKTSDGPVTLTVILEPIVGTRPLLQARRLPSEHFGCILLPSNCGPGLPKSSAITQYFRSISSM